jgi:hypothetical protein
MTQEQRNFQNAIAYYNNMHDDKSKAFEDGAKWAMSQIRKQIMDCTVNREHFPILNILRFIDTTNGFEF